MNIKKSLFLCVGLLLALTGLQGAQSLWQISRLAAAADSIVATSLVATESQALWSRFVATEDGFKRAIGLTDALAAGEQRATVTAGIQALRQAAADVQAHATPALADAARAVAARVAKWSELAVPHLSAEGVTALPAYHLLDEARAELEAGIGALVRDSQAESAAVAAASHGQARAAVVWTGGELAAAVALGLAIGWFTLRTLNRQLGADPSEVAAVANAVADGDLTAAVRRTDAPAGSVMAATARMQQSLIETVARVRAISEALAHGVDQIAAGSSDLSGRTEQQLHALGQTAATTQQLQSTVQQNAQSARQADELAQGASGVAARGGEVVSQVVDTMRGINDSSKKIADIIGVIDAIAFQTNILALNAAVEAARAGEAGRGFAVVAAEVRSLATRCADAARQIKALIEASVGQVRQGTQLVDQAGATIAEIIGSIGHVTDLMGRISSASVEQSAGVAEVGRAVSHMDAVTQQNAALAEQSAGAAESVRAQALELVQAVAVFRLPAAA